ncbi:MAG: rRNA maturation RNase YbeY [Dongiaceae bacterium]
MLGDVDIAVRVLNPAWRTEIASVVALARRTARAALSTALPAGAGRSGGGAATELTVVLGDDTLLRRLNRDFRGIDKPTNVLSFNCSHERSRAAACVLGDVILAHETVAAEAAAQGKTMANHASHLIVHGVLHLLGHDHERPDDAAAMEAIEIGILADLGIADPYVSAAPNRLRTRQA